MRRAVLIVVLLVLAALGTATAWVLTSEAALHWIIARAQARLPGTLTLGAVSGRLLGPIHATDIDYRADAAQVQIKRVELDWRPWALLYGRLHLTEVRVMDAMVDLADTTKQPPRKRWQIPLPIRIDTGELQRFRIRRGNNELFAIDDAALSLRADDRNLKISRLRIDAPYLSLTASGELGSDDGIRVDWRAQPPGLPAWIASGTLGGDLRRLRIHQRIEQPFTGTIEAELDLEAREPRFQAGIALTQADLNNIYPTWPAVTVSGQIDARGSIDDFESNARLLAQYQTERLHIDVAGRRNRNVITVSKLEARAPDLPGRLRAEGRYEFGVTPARLSLRLDWNDWRWPGAGAVALSPAGKAHIDGTTADYRLGAESSIVMERLAPVHAQLTARGDMKSLKLETLTLAALNGNISGQGEIQRDPWRWQLSLRGQGLDPGAFWPAWPGQLAMNGRVHGRYQANRLRNELAIATLSGTLNDRTVTANGRWIIDGARHDISDVSLRVGSAQLQARGRIDRAWDVVAHANIPQLSALLPAASGSVRAQTRLSGSRQAPILDGSLTVERGRYADDSLEHLDTTFHLDLSNRAPSRLDATARKLRRGERVIENVHLTGRGTVDSHTLLLQVKTPETELNADLRGAFASRSWTGNVAAINIAAAYGKWSLEEPAPLTAATDRVRTGPLCLRTDGEGRACAGIDWSSTGPGQAMLRATALPLAWLNPLLPGSLRLRGTVNATAEAHFEGRRPVNASAEFRLSAGALYTPIEGQAAIEFDGGTGRLRLDDTGLRAGVDIALVANDEIAADLTLPRFNPRATAGADQPLAGRVRARFADLARFAPLLTDLEMPRGRIDADFQLAGTLAAPTLRGAATLADGSANVLGLGIRVRKINLRASANGGRTLRIDGNAASGAGTLAVAGDFTLGEGQAWTTKLHITGERLEVANLSQAWVLASPDLQLAARPGWVQLQGRVDIPEAKLTPKPLQAPIPTSRDVVIVNAPEEALREQRGWAVETQVRITLGDKVSFDGFGLTGKITGGVVAVDSPDRLTSARGELRIKDGKYEAYGRKLDVERGRLLFAGGPIDNPGIDARAIRRVDEVTAGIAIGGTLKLPQLSLFSDPPLSESDTLSYLLFGRPLESTSGAQGRALANAATALKLSGGELLAERLAARFGIEEVGIESGSKSEEAALVLGKHLSPRLYVNYSIGLFEQVNVLRLRYQLSASWALQVESGTYAGADLLYTIER